VSLVAEFAHPADADTFAMLFVTLYVQQQLGDAAGQHRFIVARSDNERGEIIQSFTRRGIKKLPDGRKVEDIVHTPQSWSKRKQ
jgi:hypothetical protein